MSQIETIGNKITFIDGNKKITLLDLNDFLSNKSRVSLHTDEEGAETIGSFLTNQMQRCRESFPDVADLKHFQYLMLNTLLINELMKSGAPVKVVEFGCTKGDISYNLAETISRFHPESSLCLISNVVGNNSGNTCLDYITQARKLPEFSLLYCDYPITNLAENCFDIAIINGDTDFEDPYRVIKEAERITKQGGLIFCCSGANYLLTSTFQLVFSEREEYPLTPQDTFITSRKTENTWANCTAENPYAGIPKLLDSILSEVRGNNTLSVFRSHVEQLHTFINLAIQNNDIAKKREWIQIKENLLDYMNHQNTEFREFYKERLRKSIEATSK